MKSLYLRNSGALCYDRCPLQYWYQYVLGIRLAYKKATLEFGTAVHKIITNFIKADFHRIPYRIDTAFTLEWEAQGRVEMEYPSTHDHASLLDTGLSLVTQFVECWPGMGLRLLSDGRGEPFIERRLTVQIGPDLYTTGEPDLIALDVQGNTVVKDFKTCAQAHDPMFLGNADQLTNYQVLVDTHRQQLGIEPVSSLEFVDLIKRKAGGTGLGPEVIFGETVSARSSSDVTEYLNKLRWMAEDIRRGRFPKRPGMAYNTPCGMCEYARLCLSGNDADLVIPENAARQLDRAA